MDATNRSNKVRIAHLSGPTATIQNTPPLVTSNKARAKRGLPLLTDVDGGAVRHDALRLQRLAAPARIYVEQFSAHPLESDAAELYGPPDGYIGSDGVFRNERRSDSDKAVYEIELKPEDGLYPLPYMAVQADGTAWEEECTAPGAQTGRQGFFPDGSRSFEEIDRMSIGTDGKASLLSSIAMIDFYRGVPPGGFTKGLPAHLRKDKGEGDIAAETRGRHYFGYKPYHLSTMPPRQALAKATNDMQALAASGDYDGMIWTQGSPQIEESAYWFNLLIDTTLPICCNAAQRPQGQNSADGPANIVELRAFHQIEDLGRRARPQPLRRGADPGAAIVRGARGRKGRRPSRRLRGDRRPRRHCRQYQPHRAARAHLSAGVQTHLPVGAEAQLVARFGQGGNQGPARHRDGRCRGEGRERQAAAGRHSGCDDRDRRELLGHGLRPGSGPGRRSGRRDRAQARPSGHSPDLSTRAWCPTA